MGGAKRTAWIGIAAAVLIGAALALAGSDGGRRVGPMPVFALCVATAFIINWVAFVPAYRAHTERWYDLVGSLTYLTVVAMAVVASGDPDLRTLVVAALVVVWATRLGTYLFRRVRRDGGDGRFDRIKADPVRFAMAWTVQGLWVCFTVACALAVITGDRRRGVVPTDALGLGLWVAGFVIEVVADAQKSAFRSQETNRGRFITSGCWAWSRHPNYFGEILLWVGVAVLALPALGGWRWLTLASPVFVFVLLTRISGIPLLESRGEKRWGDDPAYRAYVATTPALVPRPPRPPGPPRG